MLNDMGDLMKKAGEMQARMQEIQEKIAGLTATGESGAGMVKVTLNGKGYASTIDIDPSLMVADEKDVLEDLLAAAINDAKTKIETKTQEEMKALTEGLPLPPGMKLPF